MLEKEPLFVLKSESIPFTKLAGLLKKQACGLNCYKIK